MDVRRTNLKPLGAMRGQQFPGQTPKLDRVAKDVLGIFAHLPRAGFAGADKRERLALPPLPRTGGIEEGRNKRARRNL